MKQKTADTDSYGADYLNGKSEKKFFSTHYRDTDGRLVNRTNDMGVNWDAGQSELQTKYTLTQSELDNSKYQNHVITIFELIPNKGDTTIEKVPFVGTITGINEDISPEWDSFRYIGSPFNIYRYKGVERTLQFNLKLYYTTSEERGIMIEKINYLKKLAFPDRNIKTIQLGGNDSQYAMAPNLFKVSIGELYKELSGIIDSLSFTIDDNISWPRYDGGDESIIETPNPPLNDNASAHIKKIKDGFGKMDKYTNFMYPSVIDVSISMKIIETHGITTNANTKTYRYDFDGRETVKLKKIFQNLKI